MWHIKDLLPLIRHVCQNSQNRTKGEYHGISRQARAYLVNSDIRDKARRSNNCRIVQHSTHYVAYLGDVGHFHSYSELIRKSDMPDKR
jgi:hypothetical protein